MYNDEDMQVLEIVGAQTAIAMENALLFKQVHDFSQTLQGKVDDQTKDLQNINKELEIQNQLNQELLAMKSDFLRVVNHQLNTPLCIMKGYFSMMKEGSYAPEKSLPVIEGGLERINQTVADFWDAYELEGERLKMEQWRVDITTVVAKMVEEKKGMQLAKERKLKLSVEKPDFKIPDVWCDLKKITHVISNLLDNAVYYTYKGKITASYELIGEDFLKISVKDSGAGIAEQDQKKIFQKFSRGSGASGMRPDGSGLGLFIAKKIVEGNGGEISFMSKGAGKGTTFSFTVPIYKNQQTGAANDAITRENKIEMYI
jgi:signal transduction histidine kinase